MWPPDPPEPCYDCYVVTGEMQWCGGQCEKVSPYAYDHLLTARKHIQHLEEQARKDQARIEQLEAEVSIVRTARKGAA